MQFLVRRLSQPLKDFFSILGFTFFVLPDHSALQVRGSEAIAKCLKS